jgi:trehalose 6-phosphate phosphatase
MMQDARPTAATKLERLLTNPAGWALFIDIDGTLLDIAPVPEAAVVPPGLVQMLMRLARRFDGAVALSTGRRVADADRLFAPLKLVTSGVHGTEVRSIAGGDIAMLAAPVTAGLVHEIETVARSVPGTLVEPKGAGVAVHYRNAPDARPVLELELGHIVGRRGDFMLRPGRKVLEVIPKGHSKGAGLASLMRLPPFQGRRPVMIGDDHGDESALVAAEHLGGVGLKVAGEHFSDAVADFDDVQSVRAWLAALVRRGESSGMDAFAPSS